MIDISSWISSSLLSELHENPLLNRSKAFKIKNSRLCHIQVHETSSTEALFTSIGHSLQVSDISGGDITNSVAGVVLLIVIGLFSALAVVVSVVDILNIVMVGNHGVSC